MRSHVQVRTAGILGMLPGQEVKGVQHNAAVVQVHAIKGRSRGPVAKPSCCSCHVTQALAQLNGRRLHTFNLHFLQSQHQPYGVIPV